VEPLGLDQEIRVCFLGDSITSDRTSYFNILKAKFAHLPTLKFSDLSISGAKSSDLVTSFIPAFCKDSPQIVVLMIGTNDMRRTDDGENLLHTSLQEYRRNLSYLLKKFKDRGAEIIISTLPPFCQKRIQQNYPLWGILYRQEDRIAYNKTIREVAKEYNAILNEMSGTYNAYSAEDLLLIDGLHLNEVGQCLLAKNVFEILLKLLEKYHHVP
jgi:lysophospholipase L1-like esterase